MDSRFLGPQPSDRRAPLTQPAAHLLQMLRSRRMFLLARRFFRHRAARQDRPYRIVLLEFGRHQGFGAPMECWVNRRSHRFRASVNRDLDQADLFWVNCQDPLAPDVRARLDSILSARPGIPVINRPIQYDFYHRDEAFSLLRSAGVSVPREILPGERYKDLVVYKQAGLQAGRKSVEPYDGPRDGYRAFEFLDEPDEDGFYRRYRAFWLAGWIRPSKLYRSRHWNVCLESIHDIAYGFDLTEALRSQVRLLAGVSGLDYFAVDFLVRRATGEPVFTDINVYPRLRALASTERAVRSLLQVHTFDTRMLLGMPEPDGETAGKRFDRAIGIFLEAGRGAD